MARFSFFLALIPGAIPSILACCASRLTPKPFKGKCCKLVCASTSTSCCRRSASSWCGTANGDPKGATLNPCAADCEGQCALHAFTSRLIKPLRVIVFGRNGLVRVRAAARHVLLTKLFFRLRWRRFARLVHVPVLILLRVPFSIALTMHKVASVTRRGCARFFGIGAKIILRGDISYLWCAANYQAY